MSHHGAILATFPFGRVGASPVGVRHITTIERIGGKPMRAGRAAITSPTSVRRRGCDDEGVEVVMLEPWLIGPSGKRLPGSFRGLLGMNRPAVDNSATGIVDPCRTDDPVGERC